MKEEPSTAASFPVSADGRGVVVAGCALSTGLPGEAFAPVPSGARVTLKWP